MEFNVGNTVQLKSGGPAMTVSEVEGGRKVHVAWFNRSSDGIHTLSFAAFKNEMLNLVSDK